MRTKPTKSSKQFAIEVSDRLTMLRDKRGMTQGQLAQKSGVDRKTINRIENRHFSPSMDTFFRICGALGVKPVDVLKGKRK
jgi:transcriptional regulator with XRE-family HTH domain